MPICEMCSEDGELTGGGLCHMCAEEDSRDRKLVHKYIDGGHTDICALGLVIGDGECRCGKKSTRTQVMGVGGST